MRRHAGGMPLLTDLILAMRTNPLALIRGATEFVTVIYGGREETMSRKEDANRKSLCNRIPIRPRKRTIRLRQEG